METLLLDLRYGLRMLMKFGGVIPLDETDEQFVVRREGNRSTDVCYNRRAAGSDGTRRLLHPGSTSD